MLKARDALHATSDAEKNVQTLAEAASDSKNILLVEDNPINQKVALRILAQHGLEADSAKNGKEALEAFEQHFYALVLMDLQMPLMDGIAAARHLREQFGADRPYIIAVTANVTPQDRRNCIEAGINDFVSKPIRSEILIEAINKAPLPKHKS